jgi:hypothetical protein
MKVTTETIFDSEAPTQALATRPGAIMEAPAPLTLQTIGNLLTLAVEKGLSPEALERLVALQERLMQQQAVAAFNEAVQQFQSQCPPIPHNRKADTGKYGYTFSDLPQIATVIQPLLDLHGLSYSFDSTLDTNRLRITCTVHHVAGHSRPATFEAQIDGPSAMSSLHKSASTLTYCRRYALTLALGLTTADTDDDGRGITNPSPQPSADPSSPRVAPRGERQQVPSTSAEVGMETKLNQLYQAWRKKFKAPTGTKSAFVEWACGTVHTTDDLAVVSNWTLQRAQTCEQALTEARAS